MAFLFISSDVQVLLDAVYVGAVYFILQTAAFLCCILAVINDFLSNAITYDNLLIFHVYSYCRLAMNQQFIIQLMKICSGLQRISEYR